jgi:hypothetical protein
MLEQIIGAIVGKCLTQAAPKKGRLHFFRLPVTIVDLAQAVTMCPLAIPLSNFITK